MSDDDTAPSMTPAKADASTSTPQPGQSDKRPSPGVDAWLQNVTKGFARMAVDPEYRRSIQRRVS